MKASRGSGLSAQSLARNANLSLSKLEKGDKKLKAQLKSNEKRSRTAAVRTAHLSSATHTEVAGFLEPETSLERTFKVTQEQIVDGSDLATKRRADFNLELSSTGLGPYSATYSRSGKSILVYGRKGHVSVTGWAQLKLHAEIYLNETIRDGTFLHSDNFFALAQRKYVHLYDSSGTEVHIMRNHVDPLRVLFLPYHFLLSSLSARGRLNYSDTSTGDTVAELSLSRVGDGQSAACNPVNACVGVGHVNGVVSMWSPNSPAPLAKMLTNRGRINALTFSPDGKHMVTAGSDARIHIWDLRTYQKINSIFMPVSASEVACSQRGLLAASFGPNVQVWRDPFDGPEKMKLYMTNLYPGAPVERLSFCPFEDILGVAHARGFSSMVVPGAGEPNFDSLLPNPYETAKQRREREVSNLLEKLPPETIMLDPTAIGTVDKDPRERLMEIRKKQEEAFSAKRAKLLKKKRARGRNKISKKLRRKQGNVIDERSERIQERLQTEKNRREMVQKNAKVELLAPALKRFARSNT
eukprot:Plantae.Rhodophyta-Purpureofilum_apyrenoidigerum.ctg11125.p1 GENE.Plantae.Rhodophyta-Purpureofilum_apyrenoidigerum.ctg11125~~Plantae.Rhodophyta-Purpureofilum_apyrenoidigerum.ctg11125.p1  ORF type:complete len:559 (-),score=83.46 Plantae.Rhodophyta-Purpureofilum_apyrenoidigerum.ctg11125:474-2048(-)